MKTFFIIMFWVILIKYWGPIAKHRIDVYHGRKKP